MNEREEEMRRVAELLPEVQDAFTKRVARRDWQTLLENFGLLKALVSGALRHEDISVHVMARNPFCPRRANNSPGTWRQLQRQFVDMLEGCDSVTLSLLLENLWAAEAAASGTFRHAVFLRPQWWRVDNELEFTVAQRFECLRQRSGGIVFDTESESIEEFVSKRSKARVDAHLQFSLLSSPHVLHGNGEFAKEVFAPFEYREASADEAISLLRYQGDRSRPWAREAKIWVTGTTGKVGKHEKMLVLRLVRDQPYDGAYGTWHVELEDAPEHKESLLGHLGGNEWLLGVRPLER